MKRLVLGILTGLIVGGLVAAGVVTGLHWLSFTDAGALGPMLASGRVDALITWMMSVPLYAKLAQDRPDSI